MMAVADMGFDLDSAGGWKLVVDVGLKIDLGYRLNATVHPSLQRPSDSVRS
jgi:hypothetical protein